MQALSLIEAVTIASPDSAEAWAALAAAQYSRLTFLDRDIGPIVEQVRASVARALALDAEQAVALRTKAIISGMFDFDAATAEALFLRILRTLPNYTSARLNYAESLTVQGRFDDALAQLNLARVYDPLSPSAHLALAHCLTQQRRYDDARSAWSLCRASGEESSWVLTGAGLNELAAGNLDAAQALLDEAVVRFPGIPTTIMCRPISTRPAATTKVHARSSATASPVPALLEGQPRRPRGSAARSRHCDRALVRRSCRTRHDPPAGDDSARVRLAGRRCGLPLAAAALRDPRA